jgi:oxygen-independent coproporphyrinogen-3 oxidase
VGGVRWWNERHPARYAGRLAEGVTPARGRELLDVEQRRVERVMLELRLSQGLDLGLLTAEGLAAAAEAVTAGMLTNDAYEQGRASLTTRGRLLADAVVRNLVG